MHFLINQNPDGVDQFSIYTMNDGEFHIDYAFVDSEDYWPDYFTYTPGTVDGLTGD